MRPRPGRMTLARVPCPLPGRSGRGALTRAALGPGGQTERRGRSPWNSGI
jgi:hypothetical protein